MYIAYYDESGDDGYPRYSSPLFVLSACYLHYMHWQDSYEAIKQLRANLKSTYGLPVRTELHWRHFLLNKRPYREFHIADTDRVEIVAIFCELLAQLNVKLINVAIVKPRVANQVYQVLDKAFTYSIQRIENDLHPSQNPSNKFMIITDPGRVGKMRKTSRRIQRINFIPSRFSTRPYRREIKSLIEDPLPKESHESYFIQACDLIGYIVYLYVLATTKAGSYHNRLPSEVTPGTVVRWLEILRPSLNLQASSSDPHGVVIHPKENGGPV